MDTAQAGLSLIKQLASCDNKIRNRSLGVILKTWLPSQSQISEEDMKKVWKGLFYCVWHSDKMPVQTQLIYRLTSLLPDLQLPVSARYFSVFLLTLRREWTGIDRLRLDKFYLLIRKFMHFFFFLLKKNSWDLELSTRFMGILMDNTFLADDNLLGNGVNYHIASIFLEELRPFLPLNKLVVDVLLGPFVSTMGKVQDKILLGKIKSNVFDKLLKMGDNFLQIKKSMVDVDSGDDAVVLGSIAWALGFSAKFYELGSSAECPQGNRKVLLGLHVQFMKLEKDFASSGIDISLPEVNQGTDEEVPILVPIASDMEDNADTSINGKKRLKKSKKGKTKSSSEKKAKKNSISTSGSNTEDVNHVVLTSSGNANEKNGQDPSLITFNETVISNLQMQFEKVAAEVGLGNNDVESACDIPKVSVSKKRKRAKNIDNQQSANPELTSEVNVDDGVTAKSTNNKSAKKVRFSMKNNLVWKPQSPLPPQSLRIPPSVTPRGSALKQGIPPGPIREMPATKRAKKKAKSLKKGRRAILGIAPTVKRLKKLKTFSS
ncbi:uncharacterized protein [Euphorbia lathyris]|uniref:uncharacterized protein n=1 Tax=Euphorbia lathyris TaxID=212925 RepID=UPI003313AA24